MRPSARNLLDNSDFTNFVNQRGEIYTSGTWTYCVDRWRAIGTAGQLVWHNSTDIALGALRGISQPLENKSMFAGKTYTIAAEDTNDVLYTTNGTYGGDDQHIWAEINGMELRLYSVSDDDCIYFSLKNLSDDTTKFVHLKWAALYEGEYTADTLPTYQPKGYAAELAECMRYFQILAKEPCDMAYPVSLCSPTGQTAEIHFQFPIPMRTAPTIGADGGVYGRIVIYTTEFNYAQQQSITSLSSVISADWGITARVSLSSYQPPIGSCLTYDTLNIPTGGYVYVSADL